ncbi:hypothetical protein Tco_0303927 [Tanacetum coccineum]
MVADWWSEEANPRVNRRMDDCDGDGGGEVNGEGVVLGVFKRRLEDIPGKVIGERGGDTIGLDGGVVNYYGLLAGNRLNLEGKSRTCSLKFILQCTGSAGFADSIYRMELAFVNEGNRLSVVESKQWCLDEVKAMQRDV